MGVAEGGSRSTVVMKNNEVDLKWNPGAGGGRHPKWPTLNIPLPWMVFLIHIRMEI